MELFNKFLMELINECVAKQLINNTSLKIYQILSVPSIDKWIRRGGTHIYNGILFNH